MREASGWSRFEVADLDNETDEVMILIMMKRRVILMMSDDDNESDVIMLP